MKQDLPCGEFSNTFLPWNSPDSRKKKKKKKKKKSLGCFDLFFVKFSYAITKTCLYNFDPLKPHFYIVKLGFTGVYISFHISAQNIDCWYSLEPPRRGGSNEYPQSMF